MNQSHSVKGTDSPAETNRYEAEMASPQMAASAVHAHLQPVTQVHADEETEIDLRELIAMILRRWYIVLLCVVLAIGAAYWVSWFYLVPVYQAETTLFLGKEKDQIGALSIADLQTNNQLIEDYKGIVQSRQVAEAAIQSLGLDMDWTSFTEKVGVSSVGESRLFKITFDSTNPQLAADVTNELAKVIMTKAAEIIEVNNVKLIDSALVPLEPISPQKLRNLAIAGVLGLMIAFGIIFLIEFMDHTIKKPEDIERHLGLHVMGVIPRFQGENRKQTERKFRNRNRKSARVKGTGDAA